MVCFLGFQLYLSCLLYNKIHHQHQKTRQNEKQSHKRKKNRFLPDEQYGIALDNLVKGCTDILLLHPDGKRIFLGKRCVQREYLQLLIMLCCVGVGVFYIVDRIIVRYVFNILFCISNIHLLHIYIHAMLYSSTRLVVHGWTYLSRRNTIR